MSRIKASGPPGAEGAVASGGAASPAAPAASPMATPAPKMGNIEAAKINIGMAIDLIEQSLPALNSESPEGQKAVAALRALTGIVGPRRGAVNELQPSAILNLMHSLPQGMGGPPEAKALGGGAGGPPGMPPGGAPPATPPTAAPAPGAPPM